METYYKRITSSSGKTVRYEPVSYYDETLRSARPVGHYLVTVRPNGVLTTQIDPDLAPWMSLPAQALDDITDIVLEATKLEPIHTLTEEQKKAWEALDSVLGKEVTLWRASAREVAIRIIEAIANKAKDYT
jgi:hypothetical protein